MKKLFTTVFILAACTARSFSQTPQTVNNVDWNSAAWGSPAAPPTAGNAYITAAGLTGSNTDPVGVAYTSTLRVNDNGGTNGFVGASLTVASNTRLLLKTGVGDAANGNLILNNNSNIVLATSIAGNTTLAGTLLVSPGATAYLGLNNITATNLNVNSTLTGSGTLSLGTTGGSQSLNLDGDLSKFTGNITVYTGGTFSIGGNFALISTALNITSTAAKFDLDDVLSVHSLAVGTYNFAPGTYSATMADSLSGTSVFLDDGGTITVVPEPGSWMAGLLCLLVAAGARGWRAAVRS